MMPTYRKKPGDVEAIRYDVTNRDEIMTWCRTLIIVANRLTIFTYDRNLVVNPGDYIIKDSQGWFYPCRPDIFEANYEQVER